MTDRNVEARPGIAGAGTPASRMVTWFEVYQFVARWSSRRELHLDHNLLPGTPQWCALPDDDTRKLLALLLGGVREALQHEVAQELRAAASRDVASSTDWSTVARQIRNGRGAAYIPRKAS